MCVCVCACVYMCVHVCVCVVHLFCSAQLSMFNMAKRYRNIIIIIIIKSMTVQRQNHHDAHYLTPALIPSTFLYRHLDLSQGDEDMNPVIYPEVDSFLKKLVDMLPCLVSLDISGTNLAGFEPPKTVSHRMGPLKK